MPGYVVNRGQPNAAGHDKKHLAIGLMSGTSLDAVDAVVLDCRNTAQVLAHTSVSLDPALRDSLTILATPTRDSVRRDLVQHDPIDLLGIARRDLSIHYARAVRGLPSNLVDKCCVIGAHGQTIRHRPEAGFSLQILDGAFLASLTSLPVVCDLRSADIAAGGQGAPLVPVFHGTAFGRASNASDDKPLAVVNIGGIANVSIIGSDARVLAGFDTGPGNRLLDDWCQLHIHNAYDEDGRWAGSGEVNEALLLRLLAHPYLLQSPPKSTGREQFNLEYLQSILSSLTSSSALAPHDVQATLAELTARSIVDAATVFGIRQMLICGGGAFNTDLMARLNHRLSLICPSVSCQSTAALGMPPQQVEAAAFAWLGYQRLAGASIALGQSTGARHDVIAGALHLPPQAPGK
ncbi:MAG: anhydro-N-acetylmuramic acid kinase [Burkholderiaceae bacterium]